MSLIAVPKREIWTRQPQRLVSLNPRFRELGAQAFLGFEPTYSTSGAVNTITSRAGLTSSASQFGRVASLAGGLAGNFGYGVTLPSTQAITIIICGRITFEPGATNSYRICNASSYSIVPNDGSNGRLYLYVGSSFAFEAFLGAQEVEGTLVISHDLSNSANDPLVVFNGAHISVTRLLTPTTPTLSGAFAIGNHLTLAKQFAGDIALASVLPSSLSRADAVELSVNPWQIFESEVSRVFFSAAGDGSHLVSSANGQQANTAGAASVGQTHLVSTSSNAAQANTASAATVQPTHSVTVATSTQANHASFASVSQGSVHLIAAGTSQQANQTASASVAQTHQALASNSAQANTTSSSLVEQSHVITAATASQVNQSSAGSVSQDSTTFISAANSAQANAAGAASVAQTHVVTAASATQGNVVSTAAVAQSGPTQVVVANSAQANTAGAASVAQTHLATAASSTQANAASSSSIAQYSTTFVSAANSTQENQASTGAIQQTHLIICAPVAVDNVASASSIVQMHIVVAANCNQENQASTGSIHAVGLTTLTAEDIEAIADAVWARIAAGFVPADVRRVNGVDIAGSGVPGNEWGPA